MDYKNLEYFITAKKLNHRQAQWLLYLSRFEFKLYYHSGHLMSKSNTLLQRLDHGTRSYDNENVVLIKLGFLTIQVLEGVIVKGKERILLRNIH